MKAALVRAAGETPVYGDFNDPLAGDGEVVIEVGAAALSHVVRSRASGAHYSTRATYPFVAGIDGVGRRADGARIYFALPRAPFGAMGERTVVAAALTAPVPDELDDVTAAALANPGMSSWAALVERARLKPGETVLVNGATGAAGRLAVQIARHLGAGKVIATGRNTAALAEVGRLGADTILALDGDWDGLEARLLPLFAAGVDVVLDYLWGKSAERILIAGAKAAPERRPIRYVEIGSLSGPDIVLPSAVLRAASFELMGSGIGSIPLPRMVAATGELLAAAGPAGFQIATRALPLAEVARAWALPDDGRRTVLTVG
jgi:NADPH:quinone reductase-like Zn-dependent oxidoreductase